MGRRGPHPKTKSSIADANVTRINTHNIVQKLRRYRIELYQLAQDVDAVLQRFESGEQESPKP